MSFPPDWTFILYFERQRAVWKDDCMGSQFMLPAEPPAAMPVAARYRGAIVGLLAGAGLSLEAEPHLASTCLVVSSFTPPLLLAWKCRDR